MKEINSLQEEKLISLATSSASITSPFYQPLLNSLQPWFSVMAWGEFFDKALDSLVGNIQNYSTHVVENAPSYFPGTLNKNKKIAVRVQGLKKVCF